MAGGVWPMAPLLCQRAMGIRRAWPDAPARGQHQRHRDRRKRPPFPLDRARTSACRCTGLERKSVLTASPRDASVSPFRIDNIFQLRASFEPLDLARDVFGYFVGVGVGGIMWRQHDLRVGPEWTVLWQRFGCKDIERNRAERAVVKTRQNIGFVLQSAAAGIDQDRRAQRA